MEELLPTDPKRFRDWKVTGRLGAGGMGVVYLDKRQTVWDMAFKTTVGRFEKTTSE